MTRFMRAKEVGKFLQCSECTAYKIIAKLNKELQEKGYITISGRISQDYLCERMGLKTEQKEREGERTEEEADQLTD